MDDKTRKLDYEKSANEYWRWVFEAEYLLTASNILEDKYVRALESIKGSPSGMMPPEANIISQIIYFRASCLELFLKALYIFQGNQVTKDGIFTFRTHNLVELCKLTHVQLNDKETLVLEKMTKFIKVWGRYPVPLSYTEWRPETKGMSGIPPIYIWGDDERITFIKILGRIRPLIDISKDKSLPWYKG